MLGTPGRLALVPTWLLVCAACGPAADAPDPHELADLARAARAVTPPVAIVTTAPLPLSALDANFPRDVEFVPVETTHIERVRDSRTVLAPLGLRAPLELRGYQIIPLTEVDGWMRLTGRLNCATVRTTSWSPLPGVEFTGRLGVQVPSGAGGELVLIVGDRGPLGVRVEAIDGTPLTLPVEPLQNAPGTERPPADFWLERGEPGAAPPEVVRVRLPAAPDEARLLGVSFGRRAPQVLARLAGYSGDERARVCAAPLGPDLLTAGAPAVDVPHTRAELFGPGWYDRHAGAARGLRWTSGEAVVLVPSAIGGPVRLTIEAAPPAEHAPPALEVTVNGASLGARPLARGLHAYEWAVPARLWLPGTNEIVLGVSAVGGPVGADRRTLGVGVGRMTVGR